MELKLERRVIVSWNTRQMQHGLHEKYQEVALAMHKTGAEIVALQEVPGGEKTGLERVTKLMGAMGSEWDVVMTEKAGIAGRTAEGDVTMRTKKEQHAIMYNKAKGWRYKESIPIEPGEPTLDYGPTIVVLNNENDAEDEREGADKRNTEYWITSIHFPPVSRSKDLKRHHEQFHVKYNARVLEKTSSVINPLKSRSSSSSSSSHSTSDSSAMPVAVRYHILCGDFNSPPDEMVKNGGFEYGGAPVMFTSKGEKAYDHFLLSRNVHENFRTYMPLTEANLDFKLSDHLMVVLVLEKYKKTKKREVEPSGGGSGGSGGSAPSSEEVGTNDNDNDNDNENEPERKFEKAVEK